jgi:GNAT superfamily N-acetyltransferase
MTMATRTTGTETSLATVRVLDDDDARVAAEVLARGFAEEPGNVALIPDPELRRSILAAAAPRLLRGSLRYGTVHGATVDGELAAVAVWQPPGVPSVTVRDLREQIIDNVVNAPTLARAVPGAAKVFIRNAPRAVGLVRERQRAVATASAGLTWHLSFLATVPEHRGKGLARLLLDRQLTRCDEDGVAAWLETTDPVNPPIYERFRFRTVAHADDAAWLPGLWVMRRDPIIAGQDG